MRITNRTTIAGAACALAASSSAAVAFANTPESPTTLPPRIDAPLAGEIDIASRMRSEVRDDLVARYRALKDALDEQAADGHSEWSNRKLARQNKALRRELRAERRAERRAARARAQAREAGLTGAAVTQAGEAAASGQSTATSGAGAPSGALAAIAQCESGGNPSAVGGGGAYRGLYQFDQQTWNSVGGTGDPAAASPAEQTKRAQILYSQRGSAPWPTCGR